MVDQVATAPCTDPVQLRSYFLRQKQTPFMSATEHNTIAREHGSSRQSLTWSRLRLTCSNTCLTWSSMRLGSVKYFV